MIPPVSTASRRLPRAEPARTPPLETVPPRTPSIALKRPSSTVVNAVAVKHAQALSAQPPQPKVESRTVHLTEKLKTAAALLCLLATAAVLFVTFRPVRTVAAVNTSAAEHAIAAALESGAYPQAVEQLTRAESALKTADRNGEWISAKAGDWVAAEYRTLDQWLNTRFGVTTQTERELAHALLMYDPLSVGGISTVRYVSVHIQDTTATITLIRTAEFSLPPAPPSHNAPIPEAVNELPRGAEAGAASAGRILPPSERAKRPIDADDRTLAEALFKRFPALDRVQLNWTRADGTPTASTTQDR